MEVIKKTVEVVDKVVSADGKFERRIGYYSEEEAKRQVLKYEESANAIIFKRLLDKGVMREIKNWIKEKESGVELTEEQIKEKDVEGICDGIVCDYSSTFFYYIFSPKTEDDIRDLLIYGKADDEEIFFPKDDDKCIGTFYCKEKDLVVGKKYLYCEHEEGYKHLYRLDLLRERLNGWIDWLETH